MPSRGSEAETAVSPELRHITPPPDALGDRDGQAGAGGSGAMGWLRSPWRARSLLLYGLIVAIIGVVALNAAAPRPWPIEGSRAVSLQAAVADLDAGGGIPLWGKYAAPYLDATPGAGGAYYGPTSPGDDQGAFLYVPVLAHVLGIHDALKAMRLLFLALFAIPLVLYPLVIGRLLNSTAAALVAPWALLGCLALLGFQDIYWIGEWAVLALLPLMLLLSRRWGRWGAAWLTLLVVAASFANSIRAQTGLGVLIAALIVLVLRPWRWRWRVAMVPVLLIAYLSISSFAMAGVRAIRTSDLGRPVPASADTHLVWHPILLGLGYLPNRYGIRWNDDNAIAAAHAYRPAAQYPSAAYDAAVRHIFVTAVRHDPGLLAGSAAAKLLVVLWLGLPGIALLLVIGLLRLAMGGPGSPWRATLIIVPSALVGLVPPVLTMPFTAYALGWRASIGLGAILAIGWLAARLAGPGDPRARLSGATLAVGRWLTASLVRPLAAVGVIAACVAVAVAATSLQNRSAAWQISTVPALSTVALR
jgi:hypothetical protein